MKEITSGVTGWGNDINDNFEEVENRIEYIKRGYEDWTKYIYIDCNVGSDENGDGSEENPYKTIKYTISQIPVIGGGHVRIFLSKGFFDENVVIDGHKNFNISIYGYGYGYNSNPEINSTYRRYVVDENEDHTAVKSIQVHRCSWVVLQGLKLLGERYYYESYGEQLIANKPAIYSHNSKGDIIFCLFDGSDKVGNTEDVPNELVNIHAGSWFMNGCKFGYAKNQCIYASRNAEVVLYDCIIDTSAPYVTYTAHNANIALSRYYYNESDTAFTRPSDLYVAGRNEDLRWNFLPLINGFTGTAKYAKSKEGVVYVAIDGLSLNETKELSNIKICSLPIMYRSNVNVHTPVVSYSNENYCGNAYLTPDGDLQFSSISNITYQANTKLGLNFSFKAKVE